MDDAAIGWGGLALSLILVAVAVGLSMWQGLRLERDMLWAAGAGARPAPGRRVRAPVHRRRRHARGLGLGVGRRDAGGVGAHRPAAGPRGAGHHLADAGGDVGVGAAQPVRRVRPGRLPDGGAGDRADRRDDDRQLDRQHRGRLPAHPGRAADRRPEVEARLALGQPWQEASKPFVRSALRTALTSQIENTKAVGLVFLPGAMTGLILAGADPVDAVLVQAAIMYLILGLRRHQRRGHRAGAHPPAVHARPPAGPPRPDGRMTRVHRAFAVTEIRARRSHVVRERWRRDAPSDAPDCRVVPRRRGDHGVEVQA